MNITGVKWANNTHRIVCYKDLYVEGSYFEDFLLTDCSACLSLESQARIDIIRSSFKDIINLQAFLSVNSNGAAIFSSQKTATYISISQTCFLECSASHGHTFGCFGTIKSSFNTSVIMTQRVYESHPSYFSSFSQSYIYEVNFTKTNEEVLYLHSVSSSYIQYLAFVDMDLNSLPTGFRATMNCVLTSCRNVIVKNISGMNTIIQAQNGNVVDSLFIDNIGDATISSNSIIVNELFYMSGNSIKWGSATARYAKEVSSPEVWFERPVGDCFLWSVKYSAEQRSLRIAAAVLASMLLDRAIKY